MMRQYLTIKEQYQDAILFFRLGDFYEMFFQDAETASRELEITLTGREAGGDAKVPMCGVPFHAAEGYIVRLIEKGYKVAICEQVEDPKACKGIVRREVIRVVTPGTIMDSQSLEEKSNNFLISLVEDHLGFGLATVDISTGEFFVTQISGENSPNKVVEEINRLQPVECLLPPSFSQEKLKQLISSQCMVSFHRELAFDNRNAYQTLTKHFKTLNLIAFGCEDLSLATRAAGGILDYLQETQKVSLRHISRLTTYSIGEYMLLDPSTRRNLELCRTMREGNKKGTLFWVLDKTVTSMGGRKLQQWIEQPLLKIEQIQQRLNAVEEFRENVFLRQDLREELKKIYDLERLLARIVYGNANGRDLIALRDSLTVLPEVKEICQVAKSDKIQFLLEDLDLLEEIAQLIQRSIEDCPPVSVKEGGLIKLGYHEEVDKLRKAQREGKDWIKGLESKERERTSIKSLKVGFNKVFGYYIEVTKSNLSLVPEDYHRKQTLSNGERYITPELKEYESLILGAEDKLVDLEYQLFTEIREKISVHVQRIQKTAQVLAELDVLAGLAETAIQNNYVKPDVNNTDIIQIEEGRHLVIEKVLRDRLFIPNDTYLDNRESQILLITGPNMAGKSTYMRQVALIVLLAQIGSFVPAQKAQIGIVDRIFTRIGAADDILTGQSTFMVEMQEVANILHNATPKSLIILDEVGRGTSTFDGLSIAWAVTEYIHSWANLRSKTLFATHYHELTELEESLSGVKNYSVAVKEDKDGIVFLRKIVPGKVDRSYGIHVAKLAGLPEGVLSRANEILANLEKEDQEKNIPTAKRMLAFEQKNVKKNTKELKATNQIPLFPFTGNQVVEELATLDVMSMTPLEAMNKLYELIQKAKKLGTG